MTILLAILLTLLNAASLLLVVIGLPGTWLMVAFTALAAWAQWNPALGWNAQFIGLPAIGLIVALALLGELAETFMGMAGAKRAGASGWGLVGSLIGAIAGGIAGTVMIPIPVIGSLVGACLGAAAGAWLFEVAMGRTVDEAVRSGVGAGVGRFQGTLAKLSAGLAMFIIASVAAFWP
ncbi:MAG: hypothetical protein AMXMBFR47_20850 [Planctomycetota bacterium]